MNDEASIEIVEEPASNLTRFRYFSEGKSGSILGANTTVDRKTFPAIKIVNYTGKVSVVVSCVTKDAPYKWVKSMDAIKIKIINLYKSMTLRTSLSFVNSDLNLQQKN